MTGNEERAYIAGQKALARQLFVALREHLDTTEKAEWNAERGDVVAMLRTLCAEFGDNEWEDGDHLADVIIDQ